VPSAHLGRDLARAFGLARALPDMSQFAAELGEYCADIAPIAPSAARRSLKFDRYPAKLLAMQRAAP
jgi:hypothetical protein